MPTRGSKDPNGRALRGRRAHTTFALLTDPARQIWNSFNNRANAGGADAPEAAVNGCLYDRFKSLYTKTATKPSLVIVPARFKSGTLYSQIPSSNADFTVTRPLNTATRFDSSALIQTGITSGIPRLDYYTSGGVTGCPALLVEPAATNLAPNANLMNILDTPTVSGGVTFTTGSTDFLAPDGTSASINKYVGGAASGTTQASRYSTTAITATASGIHTFSIFVKRGATNPLDFCAITPISFTGISPSPGRSFFNLASGTAITSGARIENYGNGWYRLISQPLTLAVGDLIGGMSFELASTSGSVSFATSGALNLTAYTWGAQFEAGSIATSYIPTTTGTGSRSADVVSVSGAVSGSIGQTEGVLYIECESNNGEDDVFFINRSVSNGIALYKNANNAYLGRIHHSSATITFQSGNNVSGMVKIAIAYKSGDSTMYLNGSRVGTLNTNAITFSAALNSLGVNKDPFFFGAKPSRIRAVALYNTRLTDAELAFITQP